MQLSTRLIYARKWLRLQNECWFFLLNSRVKNDSFAFIESLGHLFVCKKSFVSLYIFGFANDFLAFFFTYIGVGSPV